jgi:hypothetical protein
MLTQMGIAGKQKNMKLFRYSLNKREHLSGNYWVKIA